MRFPPRTLLIPAACLLVAFLSAGCPQVEKSAIGRRPIEVRLDDSLRGQPIQLDFYAVNGAAEQATWTSVPVDDYFNDRTNLRQATRNKGVLQFAPGERTTRKTFDVNETFDASDRTRQRIPLWDDWVARQGWDLVVLAYIPQSGWPGSPQTDPRRLVLPLDRLMWDKPDDPIKLFVSPGKITVETPPRKIKRGEKE